METIYSVRHLATPSRYMVNDGYTTPNDLSIITDGRTFGGISYANTLYFVYTFNTNKELTALNT